MNVWKWLRTVRAPSCLHPHCLSISVLRFILILINAFVLVAGATLIGLGAFISSRQEVTEFGGGYPGPVVAAMGVLIFFVSFVGCFGAKKVNRCLLNIYSVLIFSFALVVIVLGSLLLHYSDVAESALRTCTDEAVLRYDKQYRDVYNFYDDCRLHEPAVRRVQECKNFTMTFQNVSAVVDFLALIENNLECSGFCTKSDIYIFTKKMDSPKYACARVVADNMQRWANNGATTFILLGSLLLGMTMFACCLSLHPKREGYTERLV